MKSPAVNKNTAASVTARLTQTGITAAGLALLMVVVLLTAFEY